MLNSKNFLWQLNVWFTWHIKPVITYLSNFTSTHPFNGLIAAAICLLHIKYLPNLFPLTFIRWNVKEKRSRKRKIYSTAPQIYFNGTSNFFHNKLDIVPSKTMPYTPYKRIQYWMRHVRQMCLRFSHTIKLLLRSLLIYINRVMFAISLHNLWCKRVIGYLVTVTINQANNVNVNVYLVSKIVYYCSMWKWLTLKLLMSNSQCLFRQRKWSGRQLATV